MTDRKIAHNFGRAKNYDDAARVQVRAAQHLVAIIQKLYAHADAPRHILEIGSGTGFMTREIAACFPDANLTITDLSWQMLSRCRDRMRKQSSGPRIRYISMDGEAPCIKGGYDLICANFCVQWFKDRGSSFQKLAALLNQTGKLAISTLIEGSFAEWHNACRDTNSAMGFDHWPSQKTVEKEFPRNGRNQWAYHPFLDKVDNAHAFLQDIRRIGALTPLQPSRPISAGNMRRIMRRFDETSSAMTYHVGFGIHERLDCA